MRKQLIIFGMLLHFAMPAPAQVNFSFGFQADNLSISLSSYPNLVRVPGYPVYYASGLNSNYFFYDGMYWVFETNRWYSSSWYNGPWMAVDPDFVPLYLLRVPVRYYRSPPAFFVGWQANSPPRWGDHWGNDWAQRRSGWNRWNHKAMPAPAPLPTYQRKYSGDSYPSRDQQPILQKRNYRHEARDPLVRQQIKPAASAKNQPEPVQRGRQESSRGKNSALPAMEPNPAQSAGRNAPSAQQPRQRARDNPELQGQQQRGPSSEERPAPRVNQKPLGDQSSENRHPQAAPDPQRGQRPNEDRSANRQMEPGQRGGQPRERDNNDDRGQGRGR
ncbi:MAG: hypothetical protein IPJ12_14250 [Betaproteobacteria bacterium]|jgi:hypothetical protein|nr:hypothetical protein [Betaproteobacteria bacterium]